MIAVGTKTARWLVVELATRETLASHTDGNEQIECLEYSPGTPLAKQYRVQQCSELSFWRTERSLWLLPDGNYLALGSRDNFIYVYQVSENGRKYTKIGRCSVCRAHMSLQYYLPVVFTYSIMMLSLSFAEPIVNS